MQFLSMEFLAFILSLLVLLRLCKKETSRKNILLIFSYIFYGYWDFRFLGILFIQSMIVYIVGKKIEKKRHNYKTLFLGIGVTFLLIILCIFKYYNFFIDTFCITFKTNNSIGLSILLPVGISFYTFQGISYMIDIYREKLDKQYCFKEVMLYIGFFPQILSGPIVKAHDFLPQLDREHPININNVVSGAQIFLFGSVKKVVIADRLAVCVDAVYNSPTLYSGTSIILAVLTYSMQIYCDFSGYSDMAIGIAKVFGYDLQNNFNCPYLARNPSEFWTRWHISLSSWFKEYVYFPLGGNRKGKIRTYVNQTIVMTLSGIWHGANITFCIWGFIHGVALIINKMSSRLAAQKSNRVRIGSFKKITNVFYIVLNFIFITLTWVLFRADSIKLAWTIYHRMFTLANGVTYYYTYTFIYGILLLIVNILVGLKYRGNGSYPLLKLDKFSSWLFVFLEIFVILAFRYTGNTAFIYFKF